VNVTAPASSRDNAKVVFAQDAQLHVPSSYRERRHRHLPHWIWQTTNQVQLRANPTAYHALAVLAACAEKWKDRDAELLALVKKEAGVAGLLEDV